jgi:hypothetical protein
MKRHRLTLAFVVLGLLTTTKVFAKPHFVTEFNTHGTENTEITPSVFENGNDLTFLSTVYSAPPLAAPLPVVSGPGYQTGNDVPAAEDCYDILELEILDIVPVRNACNGANDGILRVSFRGPGLQFIFNWPSLGANSYTVNIPSYSSDNRYVVDIPGFRISDNGETLTVSDTSTTNKQIKTKTITGISEYAAVTLKNALTPQTICSGAAIAPINLECNSIGTGSFSYAWTHAGTGITVAPNSADTCYTTSCAISGATHTNNTDNIAIGTYTVKPYFNFTYTDVNNASQSASCAGAATDVTVTVLPATPASVSLSSQTVCSDATTTDITISTTASASYTWTRNALPTGVTTGNTTTAYTTPNATTSSTLSPGTFNNAGATPQTVTYTITVTYVSGGTTCTGAPTTTEVVVMPTDNPTLTPSGTTTVCSDTDGPSIAVSTGATSGVSYTWTMTTQSTSITTNATATGTISNATGESIPAASYSNSGTSPQTVTYEVIPHYYVGAKICSGSPASVTLTILPKTAPTLFPPKDTICSGVNGQNISITNITSITAASYVWTRTVGGQTTSGTITANPYTISPGSYENTGNTPLTVTYTIYPIYALNGVTCPNTASTVEATIVVLPTTAPTITNGNTTQTVCSGGQVGSINIETNTPADYEWTRTVPSGISVNPSNAPTAGTITGIASGSGSTATFTPTEKFTNTTNAPLTVTYSIVPKYIGADCSTNGVGNAVTASVIVMPTAAPTLAFAGTNPAASATTVCSDATAPALNVSGGTNMASYTWVLNKSNDIAYSGNTSGTIVSGQPIPAAAYENSGTSPQTVTYTVTPIYTSGTLECSANMESSVATITVMPKTAASLTPASQTVCANVSAADLTMSNTVSGVTTISYDWSRDVGTHTSGNVPDGSPIVVGSFPNTGNSPITVTYTITPKYTLGTVTCSANTTTATIKVLPTAAPNITTNPSQTVCSGSSIAGITIGTTAPADYEWTRNTLPVGVSQYPSGATTTGTITGTASAPGSTATFTP